MVDRVSRDEVLAEMAIIMSKRSTCSRMRVGVVIAREGRPIITGYNGAPAGLDHCDHECDCGGGNVHLSDCPSQKPCLISIHAEANAIAYAARLGVGIEGAELFTTLSPCRPCAQLIVASGITRVVSLTTYRDPSGLEYLNESGVILG